LHLRACGGEGETRSRSAARTGAIQAIIDMGYLSACVPARRHRCRQVSCAAKQQSARHHRPRLASDFSSRSGRRNLPHPSKSSSTVAPKRRKDFIKQMSKSSKPTGEMDSVDDVEAVSDILVVSTDSSTPVATGMNLKEEVFVASIGANSTVKHEVSNTLIRRMDLIVVDDIAAAKADSGDLVEACHRIARWEDILPLEKIVAEGVSQPRPKRIFFQSNGIADEDLAVGKYVLDQAKRKKMKLRKVTEI
jgi:hypothetical protein